MARSTPVAPCRDELIPATAASARWRAALIAGNAVELSKQHGEQQAAGHQSLWRGRAQPGSLVVFITPLGVR